MKRYTKTIAALLLSALALFGAASAQASPEDDLYLDALYSVGITSSAGEADMIQTGHNVCFLREAGYSELELAEVIHENSDLSAELSGFVVGAAEAAYCPWLYTGDVGL